MTAPYTGPDGSPLDVFAYEALSVGSSAVGFTAATIESGS